MNINTNYLNLKDSYLFSTISTKVKEWREQNPDREVLRLGIGDVTLPICEAVTKAMHIAVDEMSEKTTFRGYGEEQGYLFLRQAVCKYYKTKGVSLNENEVFISDGAKSDLGNILDIFGSNNSVLIPNPVYPVYVDTNIMSGRNVIFMQGNEENAFLPMPDDKVKVDIIYLCSPNNPTGAVYNREQLRKWVDYALDNKAVILFDSAYEIFIKDPSLPTSIFEIEGAEKCAIEFCSFSKTAGFTGTRCGYTVIPMAQAELNKLWLRRQTTKFNGVPYIVQRGAEAVFTNEGMFQVKQSIAYYMENAKIIGDTLKGLNIPYTGGENAPYIWLKCPNDMKSWDFFDHLLANASLVGTPGAGFGENGEGFFRLTAFCDRDTVYKAMKNFEAVYC